MSKRFHDSNGEAKECKAQKGKCPLGGSDADHVEANSPKEAQELLDAKEAERRGGSFSVPKFKPRDRYMDSPGSGYEGGNYDPHMSNKDVAKAIREDIKQAKKSGAIPKDMKVSVTSDSLSVEVEGIANTDDIYEWDDHGRRNLKSEYQQVQDTLDTIHASYNYDESNSMVDYFNKNFYGRATVEPKSSQYFSRAMSTSKSFNRLERKNLSTVDDYRAELEKGTDSEHYKAFHKAQMAAFDNQVGRELDKDRYAVQNYYHYWHNVKGGWSEPTDEEMANYAHPMRRKSMVKEIEAKAAQDRKHLEQSGQIQKNWMRYMENRIQNDSYGSAVHQDDVLHIYNKGLFSMND